MCGTTLLPVKGPALFDEGSDGREGDRKADNCEGDRLKSDGQVSVRGTLPTLASMLGALDSNFCPTHKN